MQHFRLSVFQSGCRYCGSPFCCLAGIQTPDFFLTEFSQIIDIFVKKIYNGLDYADGTARPGIGVKRILRSMPSGTILWVERDDLHEYDISGLLYNNIHSDRGHRWNFGRKVLPEKGSRRTLSGFGLCRRCRGGSELSGQYSERQLPVHVRDVQHLFYDD